MKILDVNPHPVAVGTSSSVSNSGQQSQYIAIPYIQNETITGLARCAWHRDDYRIGRLVPQAYLL